MKSQPENGYRRRNFCPYCKYPCDAATMMEDESKRPSIGDLSFCLMCASPSQFGEKLKLKKFDLNSIDDLVERNRLKCLQIKMERFWEENTHEPKVLERRESYLKNIIQM